MFPKLVLLIAVAQERKQQNAQLIKQREDYVRKARVLRRELDLLRNQKHEIMAENSSQRDMEPILKENIKLQVEIFYLFKHKRLGFHEKIVLK